MASHPQEAEQIARVVQQDQVARLHGEVQLQLNPANTQVAIQAYWAKQSEGDQTGAIAILQRVAAQGAPMPFDLK